MGPSVYQAFTGHGSYCRISGEVSGVRRSFSFPKVCEVPRVMVTVQIGWLPVGRPVAPHPAEVGACKSGIGQNGPTQISAGEVGAA